jgi:hypothetical protein
MGPELTPHTSPTRAHPHTHAHVQKVFKHLGFTISKQETDAICNCVPGAIERALKLVKGKIAKFREEGG